jgi:GDP-4-dehydro-6-deoxy-D-mannose reductase
VPRRILITGAEGFVGTRLAADRAGRGDQVTTNFVDVLDLAALQAHLAAAAPEVVIHLAAISHVPTCDKDPALAIRVNLGGTVTLLEALRRAAPAAHLIFASTAQVYRAPGADESSVVMDETRAIEPQNLYARTKWWGELAIADACERAGLTATVLRLFNHTHKTQSPEFFLPHLYRSLREGQSQIPVGNLHVARDLGSIHDLVAAFGALLDRAEPSPTHEVFNVCSGTAKRLSTVAAELAARLGVDATFVVDPTRVRPGEPEMIRGSHEKLTFSSRWLPACVDEVALVDAFLRD